MNDTIYVILQNTYYEGNGDPLFGTTSLELAQSQFDTLVKQLKTKKENYSSLCLYSVQNDRFTQLKTFDFGLWWNEVQAKEWKKRNPGKEPLYTLEPICTIADDWRDKRDNSKW